MLEQHYCRLPRFCSVPRSCATCAVGRGVELLHYCCTFISLVACAKSLSRQQVQRVLEPREPLLSNMPLRMYVPTRTGCVLTPSRPLPVLITSLSGVPGWDGRSILAWNMRMRYAVTEVMQVGFSMLEVGSISPKNTKVSFDALKHLQRTGVRERSTRDRPEKNARLCPSRKLTCFRPLYICSVATCCHVLISSCVPCIMCASVCSPLPPAAPSKIAMMLTAMLYHGVVHSSPYM